MRPKSAIKIFVGKRVGPAFPTSSKTRNHFSFASAFRAKAMTCGPIERPVDPFVFGRGAEEIEYIGPLGFLHNWIPREIPRRLAVPASAGIRWPRRGVAEEFFGWWRHELQFRGWSNHRSCFSGTSTATVVILMGTKKLPEIRRLFYEKAGRKNYQLPLSPKWNTGKGRITAGYIADISQKSPRKSSRGSAIIIIVSGKKWSWQRLPGG